MGTAKAVDATKRLLADLWQKNLPLTRERVAEIERAAQDAGRGALTLEARASAGGTAHKLAGSLGMFGYQQGTDVARELEAMLDGTAGLDAPKLRELAHALRLAVPV